MKILVVTNQYPTELFPYKASFILNQTKEIKKKVEKLIVLSPNYGKEDSIVEKNDILNIRFRTFTKPTTDPLLRNVFHGIQGLIALVMFVFIQTFSIIKIVKKYNIDIIHAHWILPSGFSSYLASIAVKRKVIITTNGSDLTYCGKVSILKKFVCFVLSKISYLICVSEKLNVLSKELCKNNFQSSTIYIGVSNDIFSKININKSKSQIQSEKKYRLIFAGSLYQIKGIVYLLESINILSKKNLKFILDLVGDGEKISEYKEYVKNNKLEKFVKFHGFKNHTETIKLVNEADIAIQASISEGLSVFIQESIFLGKPIIATNVGGTSEIVIDEFNGFLIEPRNPQQLAEKIEILLSNPEKIAYFSKNAKKIVNEKLSLNQNMEKVVEIYKNILQKKD